MDRGASSSPFVPDALVASLRLILRGILAGLGAWRLEVGQAVLTYNRFSRAFGRIERLLLRFRAGLLGRRIVAVPSKPHGRAGRAGSSCLPRRYGWLVRAGSHQAMGYGSQLQALLGEPDMQALLAASPQAVRVLKPVCRALAVELPGRLRLWLRRSPKWRASASRAPSRSRSGYRCRGVCCRPRGGQVLESCAEAAGEVRLYCCVL